MFNKRLIMLAPNVVKPIVKKVIIMWLSLVCNIILWIFAAKIIDDFSVGITSDIIKAVIVIALCVVVRFFCSRLTASYSSDISDIVKTQIRSKIYDKVSHLGGEYKKVFTSAELIQLATEGTEQIETYFTQHLPQLFYSVLAPVTLFFVFLPISVKTAFTLLLCVPVIPIAIASVQTVAKKLLSKYWDAYANLGDSFLENLQGLTTLKVYGADGEKHRQMNAEAENFRKITMKVLSMQLNSVTVMDIAAYGGTAVGMIMSYIDFTSGNIGVGSALAVVFLASEFFIPLRLLGSYFHIAMNGIAASDKIFRLLEMPERKNGEKSAVNGNIKLENLCFSYDGKRQVLKDININIPKNTVIGICGKSGCGKSTLASLISGRNSGYTGNMYLGDEEYGSIDYNSLLSVLTYVGCNDYIFTSTVRECLCEADEKASDSKMYDALTCVNMADFVRENGGLDMKITQNAQNLSGGQKQRLGIARAFMKNSDIYIFDEVTSNVDAESEEFILNAIYEKSKVSTVIIISHKLTNIKFADCIYYMKDGKIAEYGTHDALLNLDGEYAKIYTQQQEWENYSKGETR